MRLIDADELKKKIRHWNYNATSSTPTFDFVTDEDIDECPTVCDIEQIRDEIKELSYPYNLEAMRTKSDVLQIIDKYTKEDILL